MPAKRKKSSAKGPKPVSAARDESDLLTEAGIKAMVFGWADEEEADLAAQLAKLKTSGDNAFVYLNSGLDWEPLFRFSHLTDLFVYADPRFTEDRFNQAFATIQARQTKAGAGLESCQMGSLAHDKTLRREINLGEAPGNMGWIWPGAPPVTPWMTAKLLRRKIGQCERKLWLVYIAANPQVVYKQLFAARKVAPRCLCLRDHVDVDAPEEAAATFEARRAVWRRSVDWRGPLGLTIRRQHAALPEFIVGDGDLFRWPHTEYRQFLNGWRHAFGTSVRQQPGARWPGLQPANIQGARRVAVTLAPLNPRSARHADAIVVAPSFYRKYQWPERLTVILKYAPRGACEAVAESPRIVVGDISGKPLAEGLRVIEQVAAERGLSRVAAIWLGFEDEGEYLREWRRTDGPVKELTIHAGYDGRFLDFAPFADECD
jgi:hypothetical protein